MRGIRSTAARLLPLLALALPPLALADPVDDRLAALRKGAGAGGCRVAPFTQTYIPAGFGTGRGQAGRITIDPPSRFRFDYDEPKGRAFAIDGSRLTVLDPGTKTATRRSLSDSERLRYPLFDVLAGRRPAGFRLEEKPGKSEIRIDATPIVPDDDLAWGSIALSPNGRKVRRVEWKDSEGNLNRFELGDAARSKDCSSPLFSPAPEGWRIEGEGRGGVP